MKKAIVAITTALALTACGSSETGTFETEEGEGTYTASSDGDGMNVEASSDEGDFSLSQGPDLDVDMPAGYSVYPGASVVSNMTIAEEDGSGGTVVTMESDASQEDLLAHYRAEAIAAGVEIQADREVAGMQIIGGEGADGNAFMVRVQDGDSGGYKVTLSLGNN